MKKATDYVKVNMIKEESLGVFDVRTNPTSAVIYVNVEYEKDQAPDWAKSELIGWSNKITDEDPDKLLAVYTAYKRSGGPSLINSRITIRKVSENTVIESEDKLAVEEFIEEAINSLDDDVINVQIIHDGLYTINQSNIDTIAGFNKNKIIFITSSHAPGGLSNTENVFYHMYDPGDVNKYESAMAMAYLSKTNFIEDKIRDYEFTEWKGPATDINLLTTKLEEDIEKQVNYFARVGKRNIIINGVMTNGVRLITAYYERVIKTKLTEAMFDLLVSKVNFVSENYNKIYNTAISVLAPFVTNELLNTEFVVHEDYEIQREGRVVRMLTKGERLNEGYKLHVLPATKAEMESRSYKGIYLYLAINNQIREITIEGSIIGGVR